MIFQWFSSIKPWKKDIEKNLCKPTFLRRPYSLEWNFGHDIDAYAVNDAYVKPILIETNR